jgi:hypothetical protein
MFGICHLSIVPVRSIPSDSAEMVTQLLLGDTFEILESRNGWELIRITFDGYEGWIDKKQYLPLKSSEFESIQRSPQAISLELVYHSKDSNGEPLLIAFGSNLPGFNGSTFSIGEKSFIFSGKSILSDKKNNPAYIVKTALSLVNIPYQWGGRSPFGIDCSGFVQLVCKVNGINLPRDASDQSAIGTTIDFVAEAQPGDLAFFDNSEGSIVHVGILVTPNRIIHASGMVRLDMFDHNGIYNSGLGCYSHKLRLIKRVIS